MTNLKLERGTVVRRSVSGTKGFFYPDLDNSALMLREDCTAEKQAGWKEYDGWHAVIVPTSAMSEKDRYDTRNNRMIVWVKRV